jgi:hypothetical protein
MKQLFQKPIYIFFFAMICIALPLCLFPINLFQGEIVYVRELVEVTEQAPLSLSYFLGLGYNEEDMIGITNFYLLPSGMLTAVIFIFGIPGLIAYRIYLKQHAAKQKN